VKENERQTLCLRLYNWSCALWVDPESVAMGRFTRGGKKPGVGVLGVRSRGSWEEPSCRW
jgi:hypothetical protein